MNSKAALHSSDSQGWQNPRSFPVSVLLGVIQGERDKAPRSKGSKRRQSSVEGRTSDLNPKMWHLHLLAKFKAYL
jgi:hypothetical protein